MRLYAPILHGVEIGEARLTRLNDINAYLDFTRFVHRNGTLFGVVDVAAIPLVADHVAQASRQLCTVADGIDGLLQAEFGWQTAFLARIFHDRRGGGIEKPLKFNC